MWVDERQRTHATPSIAPRRRILCLEVQIRMSHSVSEIEIAPAPLVNATHTFNAAAVANAVASKSPVHICVLEALFNTPTLSKSNVVRRLTKPEPHGSVYSFLRAYTLATNSVPSCI